MRPYNLTPAGEVGKDRLGGGAPGSLSTLAITQS